MLGRKKRERDAHAREITDMLALPEAHRLLMRTMLYGFPVPVLEQIRSLCSGYDRQTLAFIAGLAQYEAPRNLKRLQRPHSDFLQFGAEVAPIACRFEAENGPATIDKWQYYSTVLRRDRPTTVSADEATDYHRGLVLHLYIDRFTLGEETDLRHLVWLGSKWEELSPLLNVLVRQKSVERGFVESVLELTVPSLADGFL